jgi:hypothetical protein
VTVRDPATPGLMARQWPVHSAPALCATVSPVSYTRPAASSRAAMPVSRIATAVAADRRRSMRSALPRRS